MCNTDCFKWAAKNISLEEVRGKRVLEVGSCDVNGSLRYIIELLGPAVYVGVDIVEGPGVDLVCASDNVVRQFGEESFDIVISTCVFEHIRDWKKAISNIKNICKQGGIILFIVPSNWPFHEYPYDFWRYGKEDIKYIFSDCHVLELVEDARAPSLVYSKIRKPKPFAEKDISAYQLYSIVANKRTDEIRDKDFNSSYFKRMIIKNRIKEAVLRIGGNILGRV